MDKKVIAMTRLSTVVEIGLGIPALFILPRAFFMGCAVGVGGVLAWVLVGHFFVARRSAMWQGQFWKVYCRSIAERKPTVKTLVADNWALVPFLIYACTVKDALIACGFLGVAAAVSAIVIVQSFFDNNTD